MGNKLTGDMGNSVGFENALEKRVTNGRETEICEFDGERSLYGERAL
jgi:hypothetical protein